MTYATQTDLETACGGADRLVQLADWNRDRVADVDRITAALAAADATINSYLTKQRYVPLALPYPQTIVDVAARLARYRLAQPRGMVTDQIRQDYEDDIVWLKAVSTGEIALDVDPQPTRSSMRLDAISDRPRIKDISRRKLRGFS